MRRIQCGCEHAQCGSRERNGRNTQQTRDLQWTHVHRTLQKRHLQCARLAPETGLRKTCLAQASNPHISSSHISTHSVSLFMPYNLSFRTSMPKTGKHKQTRAHLQLRSPWICLQMSNSLFLCARSGSSAQGPPNVSKAPLHICFVLPACLFLSELSPLLKPGSSPASHMWSKNELGKKCQR